MDISDLYEQLFSIARSRLDPSANTFDGFGLEGPIVPWWKEKKKEPEFSSLYEGGFVDPRLQRQVGGKDEIPRIYNPVTGQMERQNTYERPMY